MLKNIKLVQNIVVMKCPIKLPFCLTLKSMIECECSIWILKIGLIFVMGIAMDGNKISLIGTFVESLIFYPCIEYNFKFFS